MKKLFRISYDLIGRWQGYVRANSAEEALEVVSLTNEDYRQTIADAKWCNEQVVEVPDEPAEAEQPMKRPG